MADTKGTTDVNRRCARCGEAVSRQFVRVFGASNRVYGCLDCLTRQRLGDGEAAKPDDADDGAEWP